MVDLSTEYLGLKIKNPIVVGSSGLTNDINGILKLWEAGAGAIVLKSLFEEQINAEISKRYAEEGGDYAEAYDYLSHAVKDYNLDNYLNLIEEAKTKIDIPVVASVNCVSSTDWVEFATKIQTAGADALELNIPVFPFDANKSGEENEKYIFEIIDRVAEVVSIPIAIKIGSYSASLAGLLGRIEWTRKVKTIVLFNRYYQPDVNLDSLKVVSAEIFSNPSEISLPLRWIGLMSNELDTELVGTTGVHSGRDVLKMLLVGANAVQIATVLYKNGPAYIGEMLTEMENWMKEKSFSRIDDFKGMLAKTDMSNSAYERIQFMKYYGGVE